MNIKSPSIPAHVYALKKARRVVFVLAAVATLGACADNLVFEDDYPTKGNTADAESGSLFDAFSFNFGGASGGGMPEDVGLAVNGDLWRAALDTLSFMPLASTDPDGGVIITDWFNDPEQPNERFKANVVISGQTLRADALRVSLFKQVHKSGGWVNTAPTANVARQLENLILTRAREYKVARRAAR